jgi:hypothetical protein
MRRPDGSVLTFSAPILASPKSRAAANPAREKEDGTLNLIDVAAGRRWPEPRCSPWAHPTWPR